MTPEQFAYWLQGFSELNAEPPTAEQWTSIKDHLQTVFKKVTPQYAFGGLGGVGRTLLAEQAGQAGQANAYQC